MKQSNLFTKTKKESFKEEKSKNAQLLTRAGFINKEISGVYSLLPLGLKVVKKIENIIREEMESTLSAQEIFMPALHPLENYKKTGREDIDVLFYTELASGRKMTLGQSHEEIVVPLAKKHLLSYKDLPLYVYQIQNKFRNELRAKSGILRGREFLMKDLYSFHANEEDLNQYYELSKKAYHNVFDKLGIGNKTYITFASGGSFSKYSHEFQMETEAGEDLIYFCDNCKVAINKEIIEEQPDCPECKNNNLIEKKAIEVGNIFKLKTRFSEAFDLTFKDEKGKEELVQMGCYGIGVTRLMGAVVEAFSDEKGIIWPKEISPFDAHLIKIGDSEEVEKIAEETYKNFDLLYDERTDKSVGEKLADSDLIGIPLRIIISDKSLKKSCFEVKERNKEEIQFIPIKKINNFLKNYYAK